MYKNLHIVILAAGLGTRMKSSRPKVMLGIAGKPMLAHVVDAAQKLGPEQIHVVFGHGGDMLQEFFRDHALNWVYQEHQLGTGHALQQAMRHIPEHKQVLVLFGDVPLITDATLAVLLQAAEDARFAVLGDTVSDPKGYGRIICDAGPRVTEIVEERDADERQREIHLINTGIMTLPAQWLKQWLGKVQPANAQEEYYLTDIFALAHREGKAALCVNVLESGEAMGANDAWQLADLERRLQLRHARRLAQSGVRFADPNRFDLRGELHAGQDVEIDVNVIIEGQVTLGRAVKIGPFCRIKDAVLGDGTVVNAHSDLEGVVAGEDCSIGPFARLRPGTELAERVHIGNFVETKKSALGAETKANHLAYLGDARIGSQVNVGAGTITCNYDGANKHATVIEDGAFIGSNTALVAPVTVGKDAIVGAGSVITQNAPAEKLTLARAEQTTVADWRRPQKTTI